MRWGLRLLLVLALLPLALVIVQGCKPACAAGRLVSDDSDFGDLFKQKDSDKKLADIDANKNVPEGGQPRGRSGSNNGNNGGRAKPCKGSGTANKDSKKNVSLYGANGQKLPWSKDMANGSSGGRPWRIDLENPDPGVRKGSLHVQLDDKLGGTRYEYAGKGKFKTKDDDKLPNRIQKDIDNDPKAQRGIRKALDIYLKEKWDADSR